MLHDYKDKDVTQCLRGKRVVFVGDSTARQAYWGATRVYNSSMQDTNNLADKHRDYVFNFDGVNFEFYWDPYVNGEGLKLIKDTSSGDESIGLLYISYGLWYAQEIRGPEGLTKFRKSIEGLIPILRDNTKDRFGLVLMSPVMEPYQPNLDSGRKIGLTPDRVAQLNADIDEVFGREKDLDVYVPHVYNKLGEYRKESYDDVGIHLTKPLADLQADIFFNMRCNSETSTKYPYSRTCCLEYPSPNGVYYLLVAVVLVIVPIGYATFKWIGNIPHPKFVQAVFVLCIAVAYCYLADRTQLFSKGNKQFIANEFFGLAFICTIVSIVTTRLETEPRNTGFLNRNLTDEWKGWMQIAILIYHITGASTVLPIYKAIRVMVASYLFMTGYGHATFFIAKQDFGLKRAVSVLTRLNLLTIMLAYVMNTDYLFYYFSPLVSFWFGAVWLTFRLLPQHNKGLRSSLIKVVVSAILMYALMAIPGPLDVVFWILKHFARMDWNLQEWRFRVLLDIWAVPFGMITSILVNNEELVDLRARLLKFRLISGVIGLLLIGLYIIIANLYQEKVDYNRHNAILSLIAILGYILARNCSPKIQQRYFGFCSWIGKISLETFILQFHIWMAADTKGVLYIIDMGLNSIYGDYVDATSEYVFRKFLNFFLTTFIFLLLSEKASQASGVLTQWMTDPEKQLLSESPATVEDVELGPESEIKQDVISPLSVSRFSALSQVAAFRILIKSWAIYKRLLLDIKFRIGFVVFALYVFNILW